MKESLGVQFRQLGPGITTGTITTITIISTGGVAYVALQPQLCSCRRGLRGRDDAYFFLIFFCNF